LNSYFFLFAVAVIGITVAQASLVLILLVVLLARGGIVGTAAALFRKARGA